jgi:hypothetical protein
MAETSSKNLNYQQDLISGFGNLPLAYVQGAIPLSVIAQYVRDAAYEPVIAPNFEAQEAQIIGNIETALADKPDLLEEALWLLGEVSAGTLSPEAAQQRFAVAEGSQALGQQSPTSQLVSILLGDAADLADDVREFTTSNDVIELDGQMVRRRSAEERNALLRDVGLDNMLSDPSLYGFEKRQRELSGVDRFIDRFAAQEADAALQGGNAAKRLAEAESVMAAFLDQQEAERASRPGSRAATGARRPVQNAGVAAARNFDAGVPVSSVIPDDLPDWLVEAGGPRLSGSQMVPAPMNSVSAGSRSASANNRGRTVTSPPPYTDADLRRLRDEARDLENRQKMTKAQREQQEMVRAALEMNQGRYQAPAQRLLTEGLASMGASVAPTPRASKPKIKLDSQTISRIVNGI